MSPRSILPDRAAGRATLQVRDCQGPDFREFGPSAGQLALIVRLALGSGARRFTVSQLASWALGCATRLIVITGEEPLRQQANLVPLVEALAGAGRWVEIETTGTVVPAASLVSATDLFVVSPGLAGTGTTVDGRISAEALGAFVGSDRAVFTFSVGHPDELREVADLEQDFALHPIWIAPAGSTAPTMLAQLRWMAETARRHGWHVSAGMLAGRRT